MEKSSDSYTINNNLVISDSCSGNEKKNLSPIKCKSNQKNKITNEVKLIIKSIIPSSLMTSTAAVINEQQPRATGLNKSFKSVLKSANDSSFDNVMECKSILGRSLEARDETTVDRSDSSSMRKISKDSGFTQFTPSEASTDNEAQAMTSELSLMTENAKNIDDDSKSCLFYSSTPLKCDRENKFLAESPIQAQRYKLNLLTPPQDASFIDSDFESMDQDQYSNCNNSKESPPKRTVPLPKKKFSDSVLHRFSQKLEEPEPPVLSKSASTSFLKESYTFLEETLKRTPLTIRKTFQKQSDKHAKVMNFFSSKTKEPKQTKVGQKCKKALISGGSSANSSRGPSPTPLLTKENLLSFHPCNYEWGENFDYSFICEPSTSDGEDDSKVASFNISPDSSYEFQAPIIPVFKIDPPPMACEYARDLIFRHQSVSGKCQFAEKTSTSQFLRRSASEPMTCALITAVSSCTSSAQNSDIDENEDEDVDLTMTSVITPVTNIVNRASIRSLSSTHSISDETSYIVSVIRVIYTTTLFHACILVLLLLG